MWHHGQEQEGREDHQVHDPLQHRRPPGAQGDHPHRQGQRRQDLLPHPQPERERPAQDDRNDRHGRDGQTDARQRRAKRQVHAGLQAVEPGSPQRYSSGDRSLAIESRSRISAERLSYSSRLNGLHA